MHSWNTFGVRTNHGQIQIHKTHHGSDLGGSHYLPPYNLFCASPRGPHLNGILSRDSHWNSQSWNSRNFGAPITLCANLQLRWGLKQSYSPHWEFSNGMWHATCTQGSQIDSWLLMVGSQTANLTPGLSFGHNLCFKCSNESCKPILEI
jgi:hypothetical protein